MPMKKIMIISAGTVHPNLLARHYLSNHLRTVEGITLITAESIEAARDLNDDYAALVLYLHRQRISDEALQALNAFISRGGGLLAIHSASASFKQTPHYYEILGGRFVAHGKIAPYTVHPREGDSPLVGPLKSFSIRDELYIHDYREEVAVHFFTERDGEREPVVWTRKHHQGSVCYIAPGHCAATMKHPSIQAIITRGLQWVAR
jgi:type 1 glutamine amidotransferase